jgi:hypothetical protein
MTHHQTTRCCIQKLHASLAAKDNHSPWPPLHTAGLLYRSYHAVPKLTSPEGRPINAVVGFCNILNKILVPALVQSRIRPYVVVVFDGKGPLSRQTVRL